MNQRGFGVSHKYVFDHFAERERYIGHVIDRSKYKPHQGLQERARRLRQK